MVIVEAFVVKVEEVAVEVAEDVVDAVDVVNMALVIIKALQQWMI